MHRFIKPVMIIFLISGVLFMQGCGSSRKVSRVQTDLGTDLSGRWNDTDSRLTAQEMIKDVLAHNWVTDFEMEKGRKPVVIIGTVRNKSSEHIPVETFIKDIQKELINSGKVTFVASKDEREEVRDERMDQQSYSTLESAKQLANETGADFMLKGTLNSIVDAVEGKKAILYQIDLELIDLETNTKVWLNDKKIKKIIEQSKYNW
jgi:uncharacterized protein (TIGR02722 family)